MSFNFSPLDFSQSINYHQNQLNGINSALKNVGDTWSKNRAYWDSLADKQYDRDWNEMLHNEQVADKEKLEKEKEDKKAQFGTYLDAFIASLQGDGQQEQTPAQAQANVVKEEAKKEATEAVVKQEKEQTGEKDWSGQGAAAPMDANSMSNEGAAFAAAPPPPNSTAENNAQYGDVQIAPMEAEDPELAALTAKPEAPAQQPAPIKLDYKAMLQDPAYMAALAQAKQTQDMTPILNYMNTKMNEAKGERDYQHTLEREGKQDDFTQQQIDLQKQNDAKTKGDEAYVNSQLKKLSAYDFRMLNARDKQLLRGWKSDKTGTAKKKLMDCRNDLHAMYEDAVAHEQWDLANKIRDQYNYYDGILNPAAVRELVI